VKDGLSPAICLRGEHGLNILIAGISGLFAALLPSLAQLARRGGRKPSEFPSVLKKSKFSA
jgi:hypothetical protein